MFLKFSWTFLYKQKTKNEGVADFPNPKMTFCLQGLQLSIPALKTWNILEHLTNSTPTIDVAQPPQPGSSYEDEWRDYETLIPWLQCANTPQPFNPSANMELLKIGGTTQMLLVPWVLFWFFCVCMRVSICKGITIHLCECQHKMLHRISPNITKLMMSL